MPGAKPGERRGGRRKGTLNKSTASLKALAADYTVEALDVLVATFRDPNAPVAARVSAAKEVLDRGHGKSPQAHTGPDAGSRVSVVVRHIYEP